MAFRYVSRPGAVTDEVVGSVTGTKDGEKAAIRIRWSARLDEALGHPPRAALYLGEGEDAGFVQIAAGGSLDYRVERKHGRSGTMRFSAAPVGLTVVGITPGTSLQWSMDKDRPSLTVDLRPLLADLPEAAPREIPEFPAPVPVAPPTAERPPPSEAEPPIQPPLWTQGEQDFVVRSVLDGVPLDEIAAQIGRTKAALKTRISTHLRKRIDAEMERRRGAVDYGAAPARPKPPKPAAVPVAKPLAVQNGYSPVDEALAWLRRDGVKARDEGGGLYTVGSERRQTANQVILAANLRRQQKSPALPPFPRLELQENLRR